MCTVAPAVPVTVSGYVPGVVPGFVGVPGPEHPARTRSASVAAAIPSRRRSRFAVGNRNSKIIARSNGTICHIRRGRVGVEGGGIIRLGAVVVTVTRVETAAPFGVIGLVVGVQLDKFSPAGSTHAIVTAELNPPIGVTVTVNVAGEPAFTGDGAGAVAVIVKSGAFVPVPVSGTVCGLPAALSVMVKVPARAPSAVGVNVTLILQFAPAASVAGLIGQAVAPVLVSAKSPEAAMVLIVRGPVPVSVSVTICAVLVVFSCWLPKARLVGASPTAGAGFAPVPVSEMFWGLVLSLSVSRNVAVSAPTTVGVNVTLTVQVLAAPKGMLPLQELVTV